MSDILQVFISYSRHDQLIAQKLSETIKQAGFKTWIDTEISVGERWVDSIERGLKSSDVLLLLLSPESLSSQWVQKEWLTFYLDKKRIIPIIVRPIDYQEIPSELTRIQWIDARNGIHADHVNRLMEGLNYIAFERQKQVETHQTIQGENQDSPPLIVLEKPKENIETLKSIGLGGTPSSIKADSEGDLPSSQKEQKRIFSQRKGLSAIADKPIIDSENDLLGYQDYAKAIAQFIKHEDTLKPFTISINAEWGGGKTSLMNMIRNEVKSDLPTVWFDAWKYDEEEVLWAALALAVIKETILDRPFWKRINLQRRLFKFDTYHLMLDFLKASFTALVVAILGMLVFLIFMWFQNQSFEVSLNQVLSTVLIGGVVGFYNFGKRIMEEIRGFMNLNIDKYVGQQPNYEERIGFLLEFEKDFTYLIKQVTNDYKNPLVIFIDDLDRCSIAKVAELIEATNIFLNSEGCVFVLGMDMKTIAASIEIRYDKLRGYLAKSAQTDDPSLGRFFLEKIIQISFPIPISNQEDMLYFVQKQLGQVIEKPTKRSSQIIANIDIKLKDKLDKIQSELADFQSASEIYDHIKKRVTEIIKTERVINYPEGAEDISDEIIKAKEVEQEESVVFTQDIFAKEVLERFNELTEVHKLLESMLPYLEYNPRRIKRFINVFRLQAFIAIQRGDLVDHLQLKGLGTCLEITLRWPNFALAIINNPELDDELFFVSKTLSQLGDNIEQAKKQEGFKTRVEQLEELQNNDVIKTHKDESDLINLLPEITAFSNDDVVDIFALAIQITSSAKMKKLETTSVVW